MTGPDRRPSAARIYALMHQRTFVREELEELLALTHEADTEQLFRRADDIRRECVGDTVHLRGIIEISNHCERACTYCGLRRGNRTVPRYRMEPAEVIALACEIAALPVQTIVLQAGESPAHSVVEIAAIIEGIRARTDAAITLSLGEQPAAVYARWFAAGADRYLLKHETANPALFRALKPDGKYLRRIGCLRTLRQIGYQIGTGGMIGLPGQTLADIADDILLCRELEADMCSFGPFIAAPGTPLARARSGDTALALTAIAVARIALRDVHIPANTALATLNPSARLSALRCGANVIMPNFTPPGLRQLYRIYPSAAREADERVGRYDELRALLESAGHTVDGGKGHSPKRSADAAEPAALPSKV